MSLVESASGCPKDKVWETIQDLRGHCNPYIQHIIQQVYDILNFYGILILIKKMHICYHLLPPNNVPLPVDHLIRSRHIIGLLLNRHKVKTIKSKNDFIAILKIFHRIIKRFSTLTESYKILNISRSTMQKIQKFKIV